MLLALIPAMSVTALAVDAIEVAADLQDAIDVAASGSTIRLTADISENITIPADKEIILDLNGYVLSASSSDSSVITNNGTLTIQDSSIELSVIDRNNHRFKVSENGLWEFDDSIASDNADYIYDEPGQMNPHKKNAPAITEKGTVIEIYGGVITGGIGSGYGMGGGVTNNGTFTLASGNIVGNTPADSDGSQGGGVANSNNGTFVMNGGSIIGNYSYHGGGGIFNYSGTVRMNNGAILYNTAKESGGGIGNDGTVIITGGSISKNTAGNIGGGMYISGGIQIPRGLFLPGGSLKIGGTAKIYDNSGVKGNNVAVFSNSPNITIGTSTNGTDGNEVLKPTEEMYVGVSVIAASPDPEAPTSGAFTENGTKDDVDYFFSDDANYQVAYNDEGYLELIEKTYSCIYSASLTEGEQTLLLGGTEAGEFTIAGDCCKGFTLKDENGKYITFENGALKTDSDNAFTWKYDGGLYAETRTTVKFGYGFWGCTMPKVTKQYLSFDGEKLSLSGCKVCARIQVMSEKHTYKYLHDGDGKHEAYCIKCGHHEEPEEHTYGENGYCECGKLNPDLCCISDVKVTDKKITFYSGCWYCTRKTTKVQYTICPKTKNVGVKKVEYSLDNEKWTFGTVFTSPVSLKEFYIRVTDTNGKVTNWKYENGVVTPIEGPYILIDGTKYAITDGMTWEQFTETYTEFNCGCGHVCKGTSCLKLGENWVNWDETNPVPGESYTLEENVI